MKPEKPDPAQLISGEIFSSQEILIEAEKQLTLCFGPIGITSQIIPFDFTEYYNREMGSPLYRRWICFEKPIDPGRLSEIKRETICIEKSLANKTGKGARKINIDPGYVTLSSLILASTKNYSHRIYLSDGIYAEVTLVYRNGCFEFLPWTYPDYKTGAAMEFFSRVRINRTGAIGGDP